MVPKLVSLSPRQNYVLHVKYSDGVEGDLDLSYLKNLEAFQSISPALFQTATIGEMGEVIWNESMELCGDALYFTLTKTSFETYCKSKGQLSA